MRYDFGTKGATSNLDVQDDRRLNEARGGSPARQKDAGGEVELSEIGLAPAHRRQGSNLSRRSDASAVSGGETTDDGGPGPLAPQAPRGVYLVLLDVEERRKRWLSDMCCALGMVGLLCMFIVTVPNDVLDVGKDKNAGAWTYRTVAKLFMTLTTVMLLISLYLLYAVEYRLLSLRGLVPSSTSGATFLRFKRRMLLPFLVEFFLCAFHIPIGMEFDVEIQRAVGDGQVNLVPVDALGVIMFVRFYLFARVVQLRSKYASRSARFIGASNDVKFDLSFAIKSYTISHPFVLLTITSVLIIFALAYAILLAEHATHSGSIVLSDAVWLIFITASSVGYGDIYPENHVGRVVAVIGALFGIVAMALLVAMVTESLKLSKQETRLMRLMERDRLKSRVVNQAARVVQFTWRYSIAPPVRKNAARIRIFKELLDYRAVKRAAKAELEKYSTHDLVLDDILAISKDVQDRFDDVQSSLAARESATERRLEALEFSVANLRDDIAEIKSLLMGAR